MTRILRPLGVVTSKVLVEAAGACSGTGIGGIQDGAAPGMPIGGCWFKEFWNDE
jgi:hypothetical protein